MSGADIAGLVPAVVFPTATANQLLKLWRTRTAQGVSTMSWFLFGVANVGLYIYAEKWTTLTSLVGFLGTAFLDFAIVGLAWHLRRRDRSATR